MNKIKKDIIGLKFEKLLVISFSKIIKKRRCYNCICDCGTKCIVAGSDLKSKNVKSCGCGMWPGDHRRIENRELALYKKVFNESIKRRSKKLNIDTNISIEDFINLSKKECFYCGCKSSNFKTDKLKNKNNITIYFNGLDRIDSNKGYTLDNVVPCCKKCNYGKSDLTQLEFKKLIVNIYNNFIKTKKDYH